MNTRPRPMRFVTVLAAAGLLGSVTAACGDDAKIDSGPQFNEGPRIDHEPIVGPIPTGSVEIRATATDADGVAEVVAYVRPDGLEYWDLVSLEDQDGTWVAEVNASAPGFDYYLRATDRFGAEGFLPEEGDREPYSVEVAELAKAIPFFEDFELAPGETNLYSLGWVTYSEGFAFYNWILSSNQQASGESSVFHDRGAVEGDEMIDWLVSPPIDFSSTDRIQVTWQEYGANTLNMGTHALYISVDAAEDPTVDGAFEPVVSSLEAPTDGSFGRSAIIELSDYAGDDTVRLAWLYQGFYGDDWYIDDVRVEGLTAELEASYLGQTPEPVFPGETVHVDWRITNLTTESAANFTATLALPDGGGTVLEPTQDIPDLGGYENIEMGWDIELDADVPTDRYRSMELTITDGSSTWTFDDRFLIGYLSTANLDFVVAERSITQVTLGRGDPAAPELSFLAHSGWVESGERLTIELTDYADYLPPDVGADRWFALVQTDRDGAVTSFTIDKGGVTYGGPDSGGALIENQQSTFYVPRPADPVVTSTAPTDASPGDVELPVVIRMTNNGAATAGPVTGILTSTDPHLTLSGTTELTIDADVWEEAEAHELTGPLATISTDHVSSTPVRANLEMTDGADTWNVPVDVQVPWPVLEVIVTTVDDTDGILSDGESAELQLEIANMGALSTLGRMDTVTALSPRSTATATIDVDTDRLSSLDPGESDGIDVELSGVSGADGELLVLDVTVTDETRTYTLEVEVPLGEPPWTTFTSPNDATGDSVDPSSQTFDFVNGRYRVKDGQIEVILESAAAYDPATLFIESWGISSGAPYAYYRWVYNAGVPSFQGYVNGAGWQPAGTLTVVELSATEVMLSWPIEDMETITTSLSLGFASQWCGEPTYYCDHFPNGWGYPYVGYDPSNWFSIRW